MPGHRSLISPFVHMVIFLCVTAAAQQLDLDHEKRVDVPDFLIRKLFDLIASEQIKEDVPLKLGRQWYRQKGVYSSGVKFYVPRDIVLADFLRQIDIFDNNQFVTAWVTASLLEAYRYGGAPRPSDEQLIMAMNSFKEYKYKNKDYETSVMTFWPMSYNETVEYWQCTPHNLLATFEAADDQLDLFSRILELVRLEKLGENVDTINAYAEVYVRAFRIPADFDCTFVNLGLGSLIYQMKDEFPDVWDVWNSQNTNITTVFDELKKYAYRPFSSGSNINSIDPRSYFYMQRFLDEAAANGKDLALVPTWVQDIEEQRTEYYKGVGMPFRINNVDLAVCANTIFGITASVLTGLVSPDVLEDPELAQIYENTSSLIAYEINSNLSSRPDLALLYYPSQIEFGWFVSRTVAIMEEAKRKGPFPVPVMETVYQTLKYATLSSMTEYVLSEGQNERSDTVYYDDFMSEGGVTHGWVRARRQAQDRVFTTAMATNALLYTWTEFNDTTGKVHWKEGGESAIITHSISQNIISITFPEDIPPFVTTGAGDLGVFHSVMDTNSEKIAPIQEVSDTVKEYTRSSVKWLVENTLHSNYYPWNAFFSASAKGLSTLPFFFPANRQELVNGTDISNSTEVDFDGIYAMEGHVSPEDYKAMVQEERFGEETPQVFNGYNAVEGFFLLWSSVPYTYSSTLLALSIFNNMDE